MERDVNTGDVSLPLAAYGPVPASINSAYAVRCTDRHIFVRRLASPEEEPWYLPLSECKPGTRPVIALSVIELRLLAVSAGPRLLLFDLNSRTLERTIPGVGRAITAIFWSQNDANILATGYIDGSISVWTLRTPSRPLHVLVGGGEPCRVAAFSPTDHCLLASGHRESLHIWNLSSGFTRPICSTYSKRGHFGDVAWLPAHPNLIVIAHSYGELRLYGGVDTNPARSSDSSEDGECDAWSLSEENGTRGDLKLLSAVRLEAPLRHIQHVNGNAILALTNGGREACVYEVDTDAKALAKVWSCELPEQIDTARLRIEDGVGVLLALGLSQVHSYDIPVSVQNTLAPQHERAAPELRTSSVAAATSAETRLDHTSKAPQGATMKPVPISVQQEGRPALAKTSKQLRFRRRSSLTATHQVKTHSARPITPPPTRSVNSSLELVKPNIEEIGSPMPFLSPSIPSRNLALNAITPLEDSEFHLPPLLKPSSNSSVPSTAATASDGKESDDSDDETFVDAMQGSATFLPGGINVPLPKACGALFAPNGQLLTFFPPKPRPSSAREDIAVDPDQLNEGRRSLSKVARLFPTFGNMTRETLRSGEDSDSEASISLNEDLDAVELQSRFILHSSSFPSQQSWKSRISPNKPGFSAQPSQHKVIVSVYEINDTPELFPAQRKLAGACRILRVESESGADVCEHNASAADEAALPDAAHIWRLLAMLLDDKVPLENLSGSLEVNDILLVAQRTRARGRTGLGTDLVDTSKLCSSYGKIRWASDPFGDRWLVRRIFEWAEERGDTQLLACISAILAEATESQQSMNASMLEAFPARLPSHSLDYHTDPSALSCQTHAGPLSIPILRTSSVAGTQVYQSPTKLQRSSNSSSRDPSHPLTPFLDSTSSTPTFSLPSLSRQGTGLSNSGSASPEYHRSSFSAAAKHCAQSITDKFASYGTSPPTKKSSTSPNMSNELFSSLPSGSWSKSVSFAASSTTANTAHGSLLSRSFGDNSYDDAYDSDKTVEDSSLPHTPKSPSAVISVINKNQHAFDDDVSGSARVNLIPEDLASKCHIWCQYYAEQLRSWDLLAQAAEIEKMAGIAIHERASSNSEAKQSVDGLVPITIKARGSNSTCGICFNVVRRMEQVCPSCHHISHLGCLEEYSASLDDESFKCPTSSCGCSCSELDLVVQDWQTSQKPVKKKASFTDPRRWRTRVAGDSW